MSQTEFLIDWKYIKKNKYFSSWCYFNGFVILVITILSVRVNEQWLSLKINFWKIFDFLQKRCNNIPTFTLWQRKSNKTDNNCHNIGDPSPLFIGEWGLQKLTKGEGSDIFYLNKGKGGLKGRDSVKRTGLPHFFTVLSTKLI